MRTKIAFILLLVLCACEPAKVDNTNSREKFKLNGYDWILDLQMKWGYISFKIPSCFTTNYNYNTAYLAKSSSFSRNTSTYNGNLILEIFDESDQYLSFIDNQVATKDLLNLFHDAYVKVILDKTEGNSTIKKDLPKYVGKTGVIQVVKSTINDYGDPTYYAVATIKVKKQYCVFVWLTGREMMNYTYDDFLDVLKTVKYKR